MSSLDQLLDTYSRQARFYPAVISSLPILLTAAYFGFLDSWKLQDAIWMVVAAASTFLLADIVRRAGKNIEKSLLKDWEGYPTKTFLRHRDVNLDKQTKNRYHELIQTLWPDLIVPTLQSELANSRHADEIYEGAAKRLLSIVRNDQQKYRLVFLDKDLYRLALHHYPNQMVFSR